MISVIVPVYNVESWLDACVQSALELKTDVEVLLIDDGSTDGSGALCDQWAQQDGRVKVIHQNNRGLSEARNTGIRSARGSHVLFLDSDDLLDPEETDRMLGQLTDSTDVLLGLYDNYYTDTHRCERENCRGFLKLSGDTPVEDLLKAVPRDGSSCYMVAVRFVCRREFLLKHDLLFFAGIYHEDEEWTQRLLCTAERVLVTHCVFYRYRQGREGAITSGVKSKHIFDCFTIIRRAQALAQQHPDRAAYLNSRMAQLYLNNLIHLHSLSGGERKQALEQLGQLRPCARHMTGRIGTPVRLCMGVLGIRVTCALLGLARKLVKR